MGYYYPKDRIKITRSQKIAWLAGFIDGEGSFMLIRHGKSGESNPYIEPLITIPSTDRWVLEEILTILDIAINRKSQALITNVVIRDIKHKPMYVLKISKLHDVYHLLRVLIPFLILKRERAELLFEYVRSRLTKTGTLYRIKKSFTTLNYSERELFIIDEIKRLNRRGVISDL